MTLRRLETTGVVRRPPWYCQEPSRSFSKSALTVTDYDLTPPTHHKFHRKKWLDRQQRSAESHYRLRSCFLFKTCSD